MATFALSSLTVPAMRKSYVAALAIDIASGRDGAKPNRMRERRPEARGEGALLSALTLHGTEQEGGFHI